MKMAIVTDTHGNVLGAVQGHNLSASKDGVEASVSFAPGHSFHLVEVDDDLSTVDDVDEFQKRLHGHLQQHLQKP